MSVQRDNTSVNKRVPIAATTLEVTVVSVKMDTSPDSHPTNAKVKRVYSWHCIANYKDLISHISPELK